MSKNRRILLVILSFIVGIIGISNHLFMMYFQSKYPEKLIYKNNSGYEIYVTKGVEMLDYDITYYAGLTQEIIDNGPRLMFSDYYTRKDKETLGMMGAMDHNVAAFFSVMLGSKERGAIFLNFILSALNFFLIFVLLYMWGGNYWFSIAGGVITIYGYEMFSASSVRSFFMEFPVFLNGIINYGYKTRLLKYFNRLPHIQLDFPFLVLFFIVLTSYYKERKLWKLALLPVLTANFFYSYFYYWSFIIVFWTVLFTYHLLRKEKTVVRDFLLIAVMTTILLIPFIIHFISYSRLPYADYLKLCLGMVYGRDFLTGTFIFTAIIVSLIILADYRYFKEKGIIGGNYAFIPIIPVSAFICLSSNIILGYTIQKYHWSSTILEPFTVISLSFIAARFLDTEFKNDYVKKTQAFLVSNQKVISMVLIFVFMFYALFISYRASYNTFPYHTLPLEMKEAFSFLNSHTSKNDVVMSVSNEINSLLPVYTHNKNYIPGPYAYLESKDDIWNRALVSFAVFNTPEEKIKDFIFDNSGYVNYLKEFRRTTVPPMHLFERAVSLRCHDSYYNIRRATIKGYQYRDRLTDEEKFRLSKEGELGKNYIPEYERNLILSRYRNMFNSKKESLLAGNRLDYVLVYKDPSVISAELKEEIKDCADMVFENSLVAIYRISR